MGLTSFLEVIFDPKYFPLYIRLLSIFVFLTFNGLIIFPLLFNTRNKYLIGGGGMIIGPLVFLLILSILSYVFKGPQAIATLFILYSVFCIFLLYKNYSTFRQIFSGNFGLKILVATYFFNLTIFLLPYKITIAISLLMYLIYIFLVFYQNKSIFKKIFSKTSINYWIIFLFTTLYIILIWLRAGPATMAGDVYTYWGIATSFARGNYPIVLPWQPNFLTVYHSGAFILQGAIHTLSGMSISIVHTFFSAYIISAIFIFITGLAREKVRNIFCLIPSIFGLILFGGPIVLTQGFLNFIANFKGSLPEIISRLSLSPQFSDIKGSWGAGATSLDFLYYINYYTFGLAIFLLSIYGIYYLSKKNVSLKEQAILVVVTILCLSVDETLFIPSSLMVSVFILLTLRKLSLKEKAIRVIVLFILGISLFFIIQNLFRDSILTPSPEHSRFKLFKLNSPEFLSALSYGQEVKFISKQDGSTWFIVSLPAILFLTLIISLLRKSSMAAILVSAAIIISIPGYIADNYYVHGGNLRFLNHGYELAMFAIGFLIIDLKIHKRWSLLIILLLIAIFVPQMITSNARLLYESSAHNFFNFVNGINFRTSTFEWIKDNIPYNEKIIFIDEYPDKFLNSPSTSTAQEYYGFFVPTAPPSYKVLQADFGSEWYDVITYLSPQAIKDLEVDYIFIYQQAFPRFSKARTEQLSDIRYFEKIYSNQEDILLKVKPSFKELPEEGMTIRKMVSLVPEGKRLYLDRLRFNEMRRGLILALSKKTKLYGPQYSQAGDYFGLIETDTPFNAVKDLSEMDDVDYVLMGSEKEPPKLGNLSFYKFAENPYLTLWAKVKK